MLDVPHPPEDFEAYRSKFEGLSERFTKHAAETTAITLIDAVVVKTMYAMDRGYIELNDPVVAPALRGLMTKFTHECLGFTAAVRVGSLLAAYHHLRALIETGASETYIFRDQAKRDARAQRYATWPAVETERLRKRVEAALQDGKLPAASAERKRRSLAAARVATADEVAAWTKLYGKDVTINRRHWHHGSSIEDLILALDTAAGTAPSLAEMYELASHAVHVSPVASGLDSGHLQMVGWDDRAASHVVGVAVHVVFHLAHRFSELTGGRLWPLVEPDFQHAPTARP